MQFFHSRLDRFHLWMTAFVLVIGLGVPFGLVVLLARVGNTIWILVPVLVIAVVALVVSFLYRPLGIEVSDTGLRVRRPFGAVELPFSLVAEVGGGTTWPPKTIGVFRVGGFFGTYGWFWAPSWGRFQGWTTRRSPLIEVVLRDGQRVLLSVDDEQGFLATVRERGARRSPAVVVR